MSCAVSRPVPPASTRCFATRVARHGQRDAVVHESRRLVLATNLPKLSGGSPRDCGRRESGGRPGRHADRQPGRIRRSRCWPSSVSARSQFRSVSANRRRESPTCSANVARASWSTTTILPTGCRSRTHCRTARCLSLDASGWRHWQQRAATRRSASMRRRSAHPADGARGRHRRDPLHLRHHRPAQGRDAEPFQHRPFGHALRILHGPDRPRPLDRWRCRRAMSPAWSAMIVAMLRVGGALVMIERASRRGASSKLAAAQTNYPHASWCRRCTSSACSSRTSSATTCGLAHRRLWRRADAGGDHRGAAPRGFRGMTLMNAYGATETTSPATIMPAGLQADHLAQRRPAGALPPTSGSWTTTAARCRRAQRRAVDRRPDGGARLLGQSGGDRGVLHRRLLALGRHRLDRRATASCRSSTARRT